MLVRARQRKGQGGEGLVRGAERKPEWKRRRGEPVVGGIGLEEWEQEPRAKYGNKVRTIDGGRGGENGNKLFLGASLIGLVDSMSQAFWLWGKRRRGKA